MVHFLPFDACEFHLGPLRESGCCNVHMSDRWKNLGPANDKQTQDRMARHYAMERTYEGYNDNMKRIRPKVAPYPETPDQITPGCPCYKIMVGGVSRFVFVIDPASPDYTPGWDGRCRVQPETADRWVVPHFIYRPGDQVSQAKARYKRVYEMRAQAGQPPEPKEDFDSTIIAAHYAALVPPVPLPPEYCVAADCVAHDSYYVYGVDNVGPPAVQDPLFDPAFNPRAGGMPGGISSTKC